MKYRPLSLSELTPIIINIELTHLGSKRPAINQNYWTLPFHRYRDDCMDVERGFDSTEFIVI